MTILIDMSLSPQWVEFFRSHKMDAVHWSRVGEGHASDRIIFETAANREWVIFTHDLDFGTLLAESGDHAPSVIQLRGQDILPEVAGKAVIDAIAAAHDHLIAGALVTVDLMRWRVRILPIR